jgi:hypothetical protein
MTDEINNPTNKKDYYFKKTLPSDFFDGIGDNIYVTDELRDVMQHENDSVENDINTQPINKEPINKEPINKEPINKEPINKEQTNPTFHLPTMDELSKRTIQVEDTTMTYETFAKNYNILRILLGYGGLHPSQ